jgi:cell shape-determining protein MreC
MKKDRSEKNYTHFVLLLTGIFLILLGNTKLDSVIKYPFSYIFDPITFVGNSMGSSVSNWGKALIDASSYIQEYNRMKEEIATLKADRSKEVLEYLEYESLKQHTQVISPEYTYVESNIVNFTDTGEVLINRGRESGLEKGDIVTFGKIFLGILSDVGSNSALVRLPTNTLSTFEVVIVPSTVEITNDFRIDSVIKSSAVVIGDMDKIKIENMGINSNVIDGDLVLIRDEKVGDILILGNLISVSNNPASTFKNGLVSPIFDYTNILTVFVKND